MIQGFMCKRGVSYARIWSIPARDASEVVVYKDQAFRISTMDSTTA
jgi:hypothetical protein